MPLNVSFKLFPKSMYTFNINPPNSEIGKNYFQSAAKYTNKNALSGHISGLWEEIELKSMANIKLTKY